MSTTYTIKGRHAIRLAERDGLTLRKYADPIDWARVVTADEARDIASQDAGLIYVTVTQVGWTGDAIGYNISDYFLAGRYAGPDCDKVEPTWADADE